MLLLLLLLQQQLLLVTLLLLLQLSCCGVAVQVMPRCRLQHALGRPNCSSSSSSSSSSGTQVFDCTCVVDTRFDGEHPRFAGFEGLGWGGRGERGGMHVKVCVEEGMKVGT